MSHIYRMTLTPLAPYFFGGEHTFGADESRREAMRYSAQSTRFPQQSAVLGMLRKTLLIEAGLMTMHKRGEWVDAKEGDTYARAKALCGTGSFSYEQAFDTGSIEAISPIFVAQNGIDYFAAPLDAPFTPRRCADTMRVNGRNVPALELEGFVAKAGLASSLVGVGGERRRYDDIFAPVETVGIAKSRDGKTQENSFFMKQSYRLEKDARFVFYATFSQPLAWEKSMVALGADRSPFMLEATRSAQTYSVPEALRAPKPVARAVVLSQTLIDAAAEEALFFVLGKREAVRHIEREGKTYRFKKSSRRYLLAPGSVLYTENPEALERALAIAHLQRAGLNHFIMTQGEN